MEAADSKSVINLKSLGLSVFLLLLSAAMTAGVVVTLLQMDKQNEQATKQALAQQNETRARLARVHEDEQEIRGKISRYQAILAQGRTQQERRLDWVETMRRIKESRRLIDLEYEIAPQRPLDEKNLTAGGYDFLVSPMKLNLSLLHENDLLNFIADLSAQVQALLSVRQCSIQRIPPDTTKRNPPTLHASCELEWITLREKT